jgi:hypothetical protein
MTIRMRFVRAAMLAAALLALSFASAPNTATAADSPAPLLSQGKPVDWWFIFKFNTASFPLCDNGAPRVCSFGGNAENYKQWSQQFAFASSAARTLKDGDGCVGDKTDDPLGATFDQVYSGNYFYALWNDQFYNDPDIEGCSESCGAPWGHSKGLLAWNEEGEGFVLQVTTPSWPAAGNRSHPRKSDGNTLGCIKDDDVEVSQHFFSLKLNKDDVVKVLKGLIHASVVTDPKNPQIVHNGGPADINELVDQLGHKSSDKTATMETLSSGVVLISKPSELHVPPWQMVSALLGGVSLRTATWWARPAIPSTTHDTKITCWDDSLGAPGAVEVATSGIWQKHKFGLAGGLGPDFNHAKFAVSTTGSKHYAIFGDMNQQGTLTGDASKCRSSQNGRGGLFYVVDDAALAKTVKGLIKGETAPTADEE